MLRPWMEAGCRLDVDQARELALELEGRGVGAMGISEGLEREVLGIIERVRESPIPS